MSKISRNDPCPCGSGKKYKQCCIDKAGVAGVASVQPVLNVNQQFQMAVQAFQRGRLAEAELVAKSAAKLAPKNADVQHVLAAIYQSGQRWAEAQGAIEQALKLEPRNAKMLFTAAGIAAVAGQLDQAAAHYRAAVKVQPDLVEAWFNLGNTLRDAGRLSEALEAYQSAIKGRPHFVEALCNAGDVLRQQSRYSEAVAFYRQALAVQPGNGAIHSKLGLALQRLSLLDEALAAFQRASELSPQDAQAFSNWLLASQYDPDLSRTDLLARHRAFAERFEAPQAERRYQHDEWAWQAPRRLRIGYVSPDLRKHSVAQFAEPVICHHDASRFEVHAYYSNAHRDEVTERIRSRIEHWHDVGHLTDDALAQQIHADGIDILVDLSGHTAGNRLVMFARKPAPIQVTWLGYPGTTGLASMDYRMTDACLDPVGASESDYTEALVRLPTYSYFTPPQGAPEVGPLPASKTGPITFASLNNTSKINARVLQVWAQVLRAVPGSRLIIGNANEPSWSDWVLTQLGAHGVEAERVVMRPRLGLAEYLALHQEIDLALDPFPWNGGTTTMLGLWMGVPVITFAGERPASRLGLSSLHYAGLAEMAAESVEGYVRKAVEWATDLPRLGALRQSLRGRMQAAVDHPQADVVAAVEQAYEDMARHRMLKSSSN
ncbi:MAG TPA: tetratricopeptide repeat protein [Aquabacterium sp.]|nr:tetratricopeptide repeat protein [Aquabacterium sp.]